MFSFPASSISALSFQILIGLPLICERKALLSVMLCPTFIPLDLGRFCLRKDSLLQCLKDYNKSFLFQPVLSCAMYFNFPHEVLFLLLGAVFIITEIVFISSGPASDDMDKSWAAIDNKVVKRLNTTLRAYIIITIRNTNECMCKGNEESAVKTETLCSGSISGLDVVRGGWVKCTRNTE